MSTFIRSRSTPGGRRSYDEERELLRMKRKGNISPSKRPKMRPEGPRPGDSRAPSSPSRRATASMPERTPPELIAFQVSTSSTRVLTSKDRISAPRNRSPSKQKKYDAIVPKNSSTDVYDQYAVADSVSGFSRSSDKYKIKDLKSEERRKKEVQRAKLRTGAKLQTGSFKTLIGGVGGFRKAKTPAVAETCLEDFEATLCMMPPEPMTATFEERVVSERTLAKTNLEQNQQCDVMSILQIEDEVTTMIEPNKTKKKDWDTTRQLIKPKKVDGAIQVEDTFLGDIVHSLTTCT